jgi:DUF1009 family protein
MTQEFSSTRLGLIAGNGQLPIVVANAARAKGLSVVAVGHLGETSPELEACVDTFAWVRVGQVNRIVRTFRDAGISEAVMVGGIGKVRALATWRPDLSALRIATSLRSLGDDGVLRAVARHFEGEGVRIVAPTPLLHRLLAPEGHLAGPALTPAQARDVALGREVALALGKVDVGQTVVVKDGTVLAVEAAEGTDPTIRRAGELGGPGAVVVKVCKPGQDERFDLPTVGPKTLEVMAASGASVLALETGRTLVLDLVEVCRLADRHGICVVGAVVR